MFPSASSSLRISDANSMVPRGLCLLRAIDAGLDLPPVEPLQSLPSQRLLQRFGIFLGRRKTVPGILGHCLVNHPADQLADQRIQIADGRWDMVANRFGCFQLGLAGKWLAAGQGLIADHAPARKYRRPENWASNRSARAPCTGAYLSAPSLNRPPPDEQSRNR